MFPPALAQADEFGGYPDRVLVAVDRRKVLKLFPIDDLVAQRVVLLDAAELLLARAQRLEKLRDGAAAKMALLLIGEQKGVPVGVGDRYVQEVALRKILAIVPAKLLQVPRFGDDRCLVRR
jgi:hypothetical protein